MQFYGSEATGQIKRFVICVFYVNILKLIIHISAFKSECSSAYAVLRVFIIRWAGLLLFSLFQLDFLQFFRHDVTVYEYFNEFCCFLIGQLSLGLINMFIRLSNLRMSFISPNMKVKVQGPSNAECQQWHSVN